MNVLRKKIQQYPLNSSLHCLNIENFVKITEFQDQRFFDWFKRNKNKLYSYNQLMLAVHPQSISEPKLQTQSIEQEPSFSDAEVPSAKQATKRKIFTPLNIMIVLAVVAAVGAGSYYLLNLNSEKEITNQINLSHDKIITYADSSKKEGSNSGSSQSKSSNSNSKPNGRSQPAGKGTISSNPGLTGSGSPDGDDQKDKDTDESKKKSSTDVSSNEEDSEDEDQQEEDDINEPTYWVDSTQKGTHPTGSSPPMVGQTRDGQ